ncbi:MAG: TIGR01906 family membrane protein [SAR202 cluster bacterium]|nr:TIGR01906 family membrane protein [SAR202 cluster bacterium]
MRWVKLTAATVFVLTVPVFLITSNVRWVINAPFLYSYGFNHYDIPQRTGIEMSELLSARDQILDYFDGGGDELLDVRVSVNGITRSLYNEREVLHMKDVRGLVRGVYLIHVVTAGVLGLLIVAGAVYAGRKAVPYLLKYAALGGVLSVFLVGLVAVGSVTGFEQLFLTFHQLSFTNDLWQLDPNSDYLLMMFPEGFFYDATMWIAGSTVVESIVLALMPLGLRWLMTRRRAYVEAPEGVALPGTETNA